MKAKHTPGPWNLQRTIQSKKAFALIQPEVPGFIVTSVYIGSIASIDPRLLANAHLIAAAPDLLAACEAANDLLTKLMPSVEWGRTFNLPIAELNQVLCDLPKVIAKAKPNSP